MWIIECSPERPWGIHPRVPNDAQCPRCGWTAPGPIGDASAEAASRGWSVLENEAAKDRVEADEALAA
jgi:hypothetical protein